jgi:outer membrane protein assembly complex protein YaeT
MRVASFLTIAGLCLAASRPPSLAAQAELGRVVRGLSFEGNQSIDDYTLSTVIATSKSSFFATAWLIRWIGLGEKRYFDELEFRRDVVRLILFYRQSGFMSVVVDTVVRRTPRDAFVTFRVYEGEPVRVKQLSIDGITGIVDEGRMRGAIPLQVGDPFNRFLFQASADTIAAWMRNRAHPYAQVLRNFDSDAGALSADVRFEVIPGPLVRIGEVAVRSEGNVDTATVLRLLSVHPGDLYKEDLLFQSQRDLYSTGTFRSAQVTLADSVPPAHGDSTAQVIVRVAEGPRHRIRIGGGYGTLDCFRAQTGWSAYGLLGGARVLDLSARVSKLGVGRPLDAGFDRNVCHPLESDSQSNRLNYNVGMTLFQQAFLSPRHTASLGVFAERRSEVRTYTRTQIGSNFGVVFNARRRVPVGVTYGVSVGRTDADAAIFCSVFSVCDLQTQADLRQRRRFASLTVTAGEHTEDFALDPRSGGHVGITLLHASRWLGSDTLYEFNRGELEIARYIPFGRRGVFAWRLHAGALVPATRITAAGQNLRFVPPEQRFYAGGPNTVRGYGANELGPHVYVITDSTSSNYDSLPSGEKVYRNIRTVATGGNSILLANAEIRVPAPVLPDRLRVAVFVDVGQVYERQTEVYSFRSVRVTPGAGLRITTPLGPVRMDVAYNAYSLEPGTLLLQTDSTLVELPVTYQRSPPASFWRRLVLQFAIGQAF